MQLYTKISLLLAFCLSIAMTSDKPAYKLFDSQGAETTYQKLLKDASEADVVFFGENHDNPICHWLELELSKDLYKIKSNNLVLGAEMFEADNQEQMNEYLSGYIKESVFKENTRLWPNYGTDYSPLVEFAKTKKLLFIATNIPRRFASIVASKGLEFLDSMIAPDTRKWVAPMPVFYDSTMKCYKDMRSMMGPGHNGANIPKAQAIKDATMAYFIQKNTGKGKTFLHFNGAYHSNNHQGIIFYLLRTNPKLKIVTISSIEQADINTLEKESINLGDYIICTPEDMTKTR